MGKKRLTRRDFFRYGLSAAGVMIMPNVSHAGFFDMLFGRRGKLDVRQEVKKSFEAYRVDPDLDYYIAGSSPWPVAIVGMDKKYTMDHTKKTWKKVRMNTKTLKTMVDRMKHMAPMLAGAKRSTLRFYGCDILDDKGNRVGTWYSATRQAVVKMKENNQIYLFAPSGWC